jgi:hypothetical protein
MNIVKQKSCPSGYRWQCSERHTKSLSSIARMQLYDKALRDYLWVVFEGFGEGLNFKQALIVMKELGIKIARFMMRLYNDLREFFYRHMLTFRESVKMIGPNATVKVDESMINRDSTILIRPHEKEEFGLTQDIVLDSISLLRFNWMALQVNGWLIRCKIEQVLQSNTLLQSMFYLTVLSTQTVDLVTRTSSFGSKSDAFG